MATRKSSSKKPVRPNFPTEIEEALKQSVGADQDKFLPYDLSYNENEKQFTLNVNSYPLRNMRRFLRDFNSCFTQKPTREPTTRAFLIPSEDTEGMKNGLVVMRQWLQDLKETQDGFLNEMKEYVKASVIKHHEANYIANLKQQMKWRTENPDLLDTAPPLPGPFVPPPIKVTVFHQTINPGAYSNGPMLGFNRHFAVQQTGNRIGRDGITEEHFITAHNIDRFLHNKEEWASFESTLYKKFGKLQNENGDLITKCIEYHAPYANATIENFDFKQHSTVARNERKEAQRLCNEQHPSKPNTPATERVNEALKLREQERRQSSQQRSPSMSM